MICHSCTHAFRRNKWQWVVVVSSTLSLHLFLVAIAVPVLWRWNGSNGEFPQLINHQRLATWTHSHLCHHLHRMDERPFRKSSSLHFSWLGSAEREATLLLLLPLGRTNGPCNIYCEMKLSSSWLIMLVFAREENQNPRATIQSNGMTEWACYTTSEGSLSTPTRSNGRRSKYRVDERVRRTQQPEQSENATD